MATHGFGHGMTMTSVWYPTIVKTLASLPDETVVDRESIALDESAVQPPPKLRLVQSPILYFCCFALDFNRVPNLLLLS
jgi:hypothetical protein